MSELVDNKQVFPPCQFRGDVVGLVECSSCRRVDTDGNPVRTVKVKLFHCHVAALCTVKEQVYARFGQRAAAICQSCPHRMPPSLMVVSPDGLTASVTVGAALADIY